MLDREILSRRLRAARGKRDRQYISLSAGFSRTTYGRWEDAERAVGALDLMRICQVLGVPIWEMLAEEPPPWEADVFLASLNRLEAAVRALQSQLPSGASPNAAEILAQHAESLLAAANKIREGAAKLPVMSAGPKEKQRELEGRPVRPAEMPIVARAAAETEDARVVPTGAIEDETHDLGDSVLVEIMGESGGSTVWPGQQVMVSPEPVPLGEIADDELVVIVTNDGNFLKRRKGKGWVSVGDGKRWKQKLNNPRFFQTRGILW